MMNVFMNLTRAETSPDAELIAACNEFLRIHREYEAACEALGEEDMEPNDPSHEMLNPVPALVGKIVALRAVTAEGFLARARCAAFSYLPTHPSCQDDPKSATDDRLMAALMRDAVRLNRESVR
jgi:hypothetical protein